MYNKTGVGETPTFCVALAFLGVGVEGVIAALSFRRALLWFAYFDKQL